MELTKVLGLRLLLKWAPESYNVYAEKKLMKTLCSFGGGRVVRWCWANFLGVLLILIIVGQGRTVLAVGAGEGLVWTFFSRLSFLYFSPSLWETARYRLKYCLKGTLSPNQPTNNHYMPHYLEKAI